jgi:hypothetical protein
LVPNCVAKQQHVLPFNAGVHLLKAPNFLWQLGFKYFQCVKSGTPTWSEEIDSKVPRD